MKVIFPIQFVRRPRLDVDGYTGPGWYFLDETYSRVCGPYGTKTEAQAAMKTYGENL